MIKKVHCGYFWIMKLRLLNTDISPSPQYQLSPFDWSSVRYVLVVYLPKENFTKNHSNCNSYHFSLAPTNRKILTTWQHVMSPYVTKLPSYCKHAQLSEMVFKTLLFRKHHSYRKITSFSRPIHVCSDQCNIFLSPCWLYQQCILMVWLPILLRTLPTVKRFPLPVWSLQLIFYDSPGDQIQGLSHASRWSTSEPHP